ncbi:transposase [Nonomuraea sp. PA05]|uniref:transposase n=1 Tax=Nonomuraea sp. PA05 TaxID=2604466 RepID=UPI0011D78871|nr:transposase [Nonomuraea sp. PA05]TYB56311.1 transposase [Nonomuraea sp. PA05]
MGKKKPRPRRSFTLEFKAEIVELCWRGDRSIGEVAQDFDPAETAVRQWVRQAEGDEGQRDGLTSSARKELAAARGRRCPEAGDGLLREADPVSVHPFIEAEKQGVTASSGRVSCWESPVPPSTRAAVRCPVCVRCAMSS